MENEGAETVFPAEEGPTRPGSLPRTATSRWRAVTSVALQRGFGRLTDEGLDEGNAPAPETVKALRETVRLPRSDRGPTGTVRIPRRAAPAPPVATRSARRTWRSYVFFALVAGAQLVFLSLANPPDSPAAGATTTPPADSVASPTAAPAAPPPEELVVEPAEPPAAAAAPETAPAKPARAPARVRGRKAAHAGSSVF